ncbi:MAG TPA: hypothetical protein VGS22_28620 [Thermoanaerobaculia bacterium]|jgi:hypothetical protein|nr:hypothetical protein [Thermoanaerobaculia bacterium]
MLHAHLTPEGLGEILAQDRPEAVDRLLLHVLALCPECRAAGGDLFDLADRGTILPPLNHVDIDLARSRAAAPTLLASLRALPREARRRAIRSDPRFRSWGLAELLAAESGCRAVANSEADPLGGSQEALDLALLAVDVARRLPAGEIVDPEWRDQLEAYAWAHLGALRDMRGEHRGSKVAFRRAERLWQATESLGDVLGYRERALSVEAALALYSAAAGEGRLTPGLAREIRRHVEHERQAAGRLSGPAASEEGSGG